MHLELLIFSRIFENNNRNGTIGIIGGPVQMIHKKSVKSKLSLHCPFKVNLQAPSIEPTVNMLSIRLFCSLHLGNKFQQVETGDKESLIGKQHFHKYSYSCSYLVDSLKTLSNFQSQQRIC